MDYYASVSARIKELREQRNMTRSELAEGICSVSHISRIESGARCPNALILRQISNKLGVTADILLRSVESPTSLDLYEMINQLSRDMEYNHFEKVYNITSQVNIEEIHSSEDKQIILTLSCLSENAIKFIPEVTIRKLQDILDISYTDEAQPTNIEFALLIELANCYMQLNNLEKAKQIISFLEQADEVTLFHRVLQPLIRLNTTSAIIAYHEKSYDKAQELIDKAISVAKKLCYHASLIECYYAKGRIYEKQNMPEEASLCFNNSKTLIDLLFDSESKQFNIHIDHFFDLDIK